MGFRGRKQQKFKNNSGKRHQHWQSNSIGTPKKEFRHIEQLTEDEVGVKEYVNPDCSGFTGVLKARFSDFHVNEIDLDDTVAILNDRSIPKIETTTIDHSSIIETPLNLIPQQIWDEIKNIPENSDSDKVVELKVTDLSKDNRKTIHLKIKEIFGSKIMADTVDSGEQKVMRFKKMPQGGEKRTTWSEDWGEYVHFLVFKEGLDTMNACYKIAEALRMKPCNFNYAGLKDKRAKTTQWFSVRKVEPGKLISKTKNLRNIKLGNIKFKNNPLKLGQLKGNKFKIVIKNIVCEDDIVKKAVHNCIQTGFINYYGLQRFGNDKEVPTYSIGLELLRGNWKEACKLILKPKKSDEPDSDLAKAKHIYTETGKAKEALEILENNGNNCVEAILLEGLAKENKNDFVNALSRIPRNMRLLYIHSFQSLIWNRMVSQRLEKYGFKPRLNDLVIIDDKYLETEFENDEEENIEEPQKIKARVKSLSESDLDCYTIFDIVLPLPGYDIEYPENMQVEYREELTKHGLSLEMPKQSVKTYTLSGTYRKILKRVPDLEWKIMRYNDPNCSLVSSDFDKLIHKDPPEDIPDGKFKAVILEFSLDSSSYATMVLREIMKIDTSPSAQVKLNNYAEDDAAKKIDVDKKKMEEANETIDTYIEGSLMNDDQKMEEFKKKIFSGIPKRKNEEENNDDVKRTKTI